ncbi:pyridoxal-5'-phosphate-dependent enzyme subunit beta [Mycolicibacterium mageritense DSM 44476 = CIP 104973]|jgi:cysteine synthase|uniref:PLP-dependent cysteine synthase family protein n=2 Tax=Mycolicibacterium TaxID=1866885 RepID=A0A6H0SDB7_9MYCO|nr:MULTISPECIES: PLP-dependent cysteine synthase family protein [Mycolicibacterium]MBX9920264.1 PLP-dependent cysteine synthase family protein [Mycolicibacterium frederiksbergense]MCC9185575.1 PLP-dependent cysteine synthase family protein [Mycolicibacterium mageritense]MCV7213098.1 PLP-dependent cysteine synthase family protein [Mycolicibacterium canariasense]MDO0973505.1 PLP-dependent cysteine synthase family protein [Mycolicibacterium frederiksbergense]ORU96187.1 pyridoxal-5'-phosphate-depe
MNHVLSIHAAPNAHLPELPHLGRYERPATMVGQTPVLRITEPFSNAGQGFWAKLEGFNPGGMKDRPALHMVARARACGALVPGARIVESTSGTLGLGLALAGTVYGHPVTLVTDPGLEPIIQNMLAAFGAQVELVTEPHPHGGWQQARKDRVAEIVQSDPHAWHPDQYNNPHNVEAYRGLALELHQQLGPVDVLVCSVGTGGHSAGVARVLREFNPGMKLIGVDTVGSTIFGQTASTRLMRGLGSSIYPGNVDYRAFDEVHWVAPQEAVWACRTLASTYYASGGWSVGAVALVAGWAARTAAAGQTIAAVFPDGPQRYFDTVYNDDYCRTHGLLDVTPASEPATIDDPMSQAVTSWTRCAHVVDPTKAGR